MKYIIYHIIFIINIWDKFQKNIFFRLKYACNISLVSPKYFERISSRSPLVRVRGWKVATNYCWEVPHLTLYYRVPHTLFYFHISIFYRQIFSFSIDMNKGRFITSARTSCTTFGGPIRSSVRKSFSSSSSSPPDLHHPLLHPRYTLLQLTCPCYPPFPPCYTLVTPMLYPVTSALHPCLDTKSKYLCPWPSLLLLHKIMDYTVNQLSCS